MSSSLSVKGLHASRFASVLLLALCAAPTLFAQDPFEPNDTCATAAPLPLGPTTGLTLGPDDDYYLVSVPADALIEVTATDTGGNPLPVELWELGCTTAITAGLAGPLQWADCGGAARDIVLAVPAGGASMLSYSLDVSATSIVDDSYEPNDSCLGNGPSVIRDFMISNLVVSRCSEDNWAIGVQTMSYEVQVDVLYDSGQGAVVVELLDNNCALLATGTPTAHGMSVHYTNPAAGLQVVKIRIAVAPGTQLVDYTLVSCFGGAAFTPLLGYQSCTALANSTGVPAGLCAWGSDVVAQNSVHLYVGDLPANSFGYFIASQTFFLVSMPGNTMGNLCLGSPGRYSYDIRNSGAGFVPYQPDLAITPLPGGAFTSVMPGERWYWQYWYRDAIQGTATSNFSGSIYIDFM